MSRTTSATITASGPLTRWRTIDLLTCAFLGVAFGVAYWAWGLVYAVPSNAVSAAFPPLAALFTELLAAVVSALIGTQWGLATLVSGLVQGLGVELGFAAFGYTVYRWAPLLLGGFLGGAFEAVYEWYSYWTDWGWGYKIAYLLLLGGCV